MMRFLSCLVLAVAVFIPAVASAAVPTDGINAVLKALGDAFNKSDANAAAALMTEDGDLINPWGVPAKGRSAAAAVMAADMAGPLKGATSTFTADKVRELAPNVYLVDATDEADGMTGADGKKMTGKLHVTFVMVRGQDQKLLIAAARPYMFMPPRAQASAMR